MNKIIDYILLIYFIFWSGGCISFGYLPAWQVYVLPIVLYIFLKRGFRVNIPICSLMICMYVVLVIQYLVNGTVLNSLISSICLVSVMALSAIFLAPNFRKIFINIITFFSLASLVIWLIDIFPSGHTFLINIASKLPQLGLENLADYHETNVNRSTIYLYTLANDITSKFPRNSGPFYEAGRFTIYLTFALFLQLMTDNKKKIDKYKLVVIVLANITTFSTTGYIAMIIASLTFVFFKKGGAIRTIIMIPICFVLIKYMMSLDFMSDKLSMMASTNDETLSRFAAFTYHVPFIKESPIFGYGPYIPLLNMSPCGWTSCALFWGIPFTLYFVYLLYRGTTTYIVSNNHLKVKRIMAVVLLLILSFSQTIMTEPFFYLLYFIGLPQKYKYETSKKNRYRL